jgi:hypothetical protein
MALHFFLAVKDKSRIRKEGHRVQTSLHLFRGRQSSKSIEDESGQSDPAFSRIFLHFEMNVAGYCFAKESMLFAASLKVNSQHSL